MFIWFSKSIGVCDSNLAELCALKKAMCIFITSRWFNFGRIIFESDSSNVIK